MTHRYRRYGTPGPLRKRLHNGGDRGALRLRRMSAICARAGIGSTDVIQALIPKPAQPGTLPAFNWSAITPAEIERLRSMGLLSEHHRKMALGMREGGQESTGLGKPESSARLDGLSQSEAAYFSEMRSHALKHGLDWAADNRDILRLGPAAIETFAKMKFERESYLALTRDAGATPKEVLALVHAAKEARVKPEELNDLAKKFGATSQGLAPDEQKRRMEQMTEWMTLLGKDPAKAAAKLDEMRKERDELVKRHPEKAKAAAEEEKAQQDIQKRIELERKIGVGVGANEKKANDLAAEADALLAGTPQQKAQTPIMTGPGASPVPSTPAVAVQPATPPADTSKPGTGSAATQATPTPPPSGLKPASPS